VDCQDESNISVDAWKMPLVLMSVLCVGREGKAGESQGGGQGRLTFSDSQFVQVMSVQ
jgi:hypothetical protein